MRLKTVKLAGFKSFVDPTTVNLPSNMCAVVGPNGCGKSNIIDAVRWVMGESSAKNLRGEAMTDVIFNGSGSRKPVGQASIELVFDNSDATIKGEYAGYSEVSVKRRVTRDGQNLYYLNNNRCRRRDITDLFLGTGLGPRSYAIIEQGMISRLLEAKPEDLRVFIEEAAGISKYKERRRDTENRMRRTHENLERLTDLREELERQLIRLERQAKAAEKYSIYKKEERSLKAKVRALRYQVLQTEAELLKKNISEAELSVESAVTQRVKYDSAIEKYRVAFTEKSDFFNEIQGQYYAIGADIARVEQTIKHAQDKERGLRLDLEQTERDVRESEEHFALDIAKIEGWEAELLEIAPELDILDQERKESHEVLSEAEESMHGWQQNWDQFNQQAAEPKQTAEVQQSRIQYLDQVQQRLLQRKEKVSEELSALESAHDDEDLSLHVQELSELELAIEEQSNNVAAKTQQIQELREQQENHSAVRSELQTQLQQNRGRLASLEALQTAALGKESNADLEVWLDSHGLSTASRLAEKIEVQSGWETALETVLGSSLQAICSDEDVESFVGKLRQVGAQLEIFCRPSSGLSTSAGADDLLLSKISSDIDLSHVLANIRIAEDLNDAQQKLNSLQGEESLVTKDGFWLSRSWIRVNSKSANEQGVLARKKDIENLERAIETLDANLDKENEALKEKSDHLEQAERDRETARGLYDKNQREANALRSDIANKRSLLEQVAQKKERAKSDISEIAEQLDAESENLIEARALLEEAIVAIEKDSEQREELLTARDSIRGSLDAARQKARHAQDKSHELAMRNRSIQTQLESMRQGIQRLKEQIERAQVRRDQLRETLAETSDPAEEHQLELENLLERRIDNEQKLSEARRNVEATEHALRDAEKSRDAAETELAAFRSALETARLELKTLEVKAQDIKQRLNEDEFNLSEVLETLGSEDNVESFEAELSQLEQRISRLGAINLAAIDEYKTESERKHYLDEQNEDLCEALETLEAAIRKIDKETRTRFKETYDQVNSGLQNLFPRLFGGGHAYLELTGDDLLDTGIAIMARPPGKKNSTIHLLSGGEKALTAIALVFSIFQLNPAPFCMLDEVDAPLDDANVGRYADMVEAMSEKVQFIYITHNKIAMEKARHLMGVTMQEAGVSRMVTVDVEEAAELAAI